MAFSGNGSGSNLGINSEVLLCDFMVKRSQNKSRLTVSFNYKSRWFVLYPDVLRYCDGSLHVSSSPFTICDQCKYLGFDIWIVFVSRKHYKYFWNNCKTKWYIYVGRGWKREESCESQHGFSRWGGRRYGVEAQYIPGSLCFGSWTYFQNSFGFLVPSLYALGKESREFLFLD